MAVTAAEAARGSGGPDGIFVRELRFCFFVAAFAIGSYLANAFIKAFYF